MLELSPKVSKGVKNNKTLLDAFCFFKYGSGVGFCKRCHISAPDFFLHLYLRRVFANNLSTGRLLSSKPTIFADDNVYKRTPNE